MWTIDLPLRIPVSKSSEFSLNLNQYRNAHFQVLDKAKKNFTELAVGLIKKQQIPKLNHCLLEYRVYPGTRQLCDVNNICSVADKFFSDSLVAAGVLEDDNYNFISDSRFLFGHVDRENPRITVTIKRHHEKEGSDPMKIQTIVTLTQEDVNTAFREFLAKSNFVVPSGTNIFLTGLEDNTFELEFQPELGSIPTTEKKPRKPRLEPTAAIAAVNEELKTATPVVEEATPTPASPTEIDHSPKTEAELHLDSVKGTPEEAEARAKVEAERQAKEANDQPTGEVPPPAKKGLFADFTRPKN